MNHFDTFGLVPSPDVDVPALEKKLRELSLQYHPDRLRTADAKTRIQALEKTAAINDAYKVLRDPIRRAFHLLQLRGIDLDNESSAARTPMPPAFLEEVMERREQLEDLQGKKDLPGIQAMAKTITTEKNHALETAMNALRGQDTATATHQLGRVRYFVRFLEEVARFEEEQLS